MRKLISAGRVRLSAIGILTAIGLGSFASAAPVLPTVTAFATGAIASLDGSATGLITFSRTGDTSAALTVNFSLGGTAAKWTDYYRLPQGDMPVTVTIPAGSSSAALPITARNNVTGANPETVLFTLSADPSYTIGNASTVKLTIVPTIPAIPMVTVVATDAIARLDGSEIGLITFTRIGATSADLTVNFSLGGTAAKWADYYRLPQGDMPVAVTIPAGSSSAALPITARANSMGANPETVLFTLSADPAYTIGAASIATLTIVPALPPLPTVTVVATAGTASLDGSEIGLIAFTRTGATSADLTVSYSLGGTAAKWTDYYRLPQGDMPVVVVIPAGSSSVALPITARANSTAANPETVLFTLSADPSYTIGSAGTTTLTIVPVASPTAPTAIAPPPPAGSTGGSNSTGAAGPTGVIAGTSGTDSANRTADSIAAGDNVDDTALHLPAVGDYLLHVLSPSLLELVFINTKQPDPALVTNWNFVNSSGHATEPAAAEFTVTVDGQTVPVQGVGFKRRVLSAPLLTYGLRVENNLYLEIARPIADGQLVTVANPDGSIWSASTQFTALATPQRYSPAIHVNEEGYVPAFAKTAMVGYYLGDLGEMPINVGAGFKLIDATTGAVAYSGSLTVRQDTGYTTTPVPYQQVYVADFSTFTTPGQYQIQVPGLGASLPFLIDDGIAMAWTRTYALGMYEQRSGMAVSLPYTRFTHAADHTAPASIPVPDTNPLFSFTWNCISGYATTVNTANPPQLAPFLTSNETSLYPFVNTGKIDVSGGHFDAGDYSKYTSNSAQLIHELIFAGDNIPGLQQYDNLGILESGDGIPDVLQEAKWEADFLAKMQDADGGFYFLVYPIAREYESNVLPENGDAQVVWPKTTSVTAAAVAALAEAGSSPTMIKYYPQAAAKYLQEAQLGWQFLMNAIAKYGLAGSYQKITFYTDDWTHNDELAWAAAALYAATGNPQYQTKLFQWFPNPADPATFRWGWWRMAEGWGNAIRTYAFAGRSGRLPSSALDPSYLAACNGQIVAAGDDAAAWGSACAYGTPFPPATKAVLGGGWYFSLDQASDMAVAYQIDPKPAYIDGLVAAMNYEGGCNPVNVCYLEGLGQKRQQQVVSQYAQNSRRVLAPSGIPLGQVTAAFEYLSSYGPELSELSYPTDSGTANPFPYYDRWSDAYNVTTEMITVNQARSLISVGFLASLTNSSSTAWTAPQATITAPTVTVLLNTPVTLSVQVAGQSLTNARIVWEARDQQPAFGSTATFSPVNNGDQWVEAEVEWPDGRRAFAKSDFQANNPVQIWIDDSLPANAATGSDGGDRWNWISAGPAPESGVLAMQTIAAAGLHENWFTGTSGPMQVQTGDTLFAWVYLDPANPPAEIMVGWNDGSSWEHRAYWGANDITYGATGTAGRYYGGALPAVGQWVKLSIPAGAVGLAGAAVSGLDLSLFNGRVTWDAIGRASASQ